MVDFDTGKRRIGQFLRDWSGISSHLHIRTPHDCTEELKAYLDDFDDQQNVLVFHFNLRLYFGNERMLASDLAEDFQFSGIRSLHHILDCLEQELDDEVYVKRIILLQRAELLTSFRFRSIREFFSFFHQNGAERFKVVTLSCLAWPIITANLNIDHRLCPLTTDVSIKAASKVEKQNILLEEFPNDSDIIRKVYPLLEAAFIQFAKRRECLTRIIAATKAEKENIPLARLYDIAKDVISGTRTTYYHVDTSILPAATILTLISAYFASYNPANRDAQFFEATAAGKRRRVDKSRKIILNSGPKPFVLQRLENLYSLLRTNFCSTIDTPVLNTREQIPLLLKYGHLQQVSEYTNLRLPKFRCVASLSFVQRMADHFVENHTRKTGNREADRFLVKNFLVNTVGK